MIDKLFKQNQDEHGISTKSLAVAVGISAKHLSEFRNGKTNITLELLWRLLEAMDQLSPGARRDFGLRVAGCWGGLSSRDLVAALPPQELAQVINDEQLASLMGAFAETIKNSRGRKGQVAGGKRAATLVLS